MLHAIGGGSDFVGSSKIKQAILVTNNWCIDTAPKSPQPILEQPDLTVRWFCGAAETLALRKPYAAFIYSAIDCQRARSWFSFFNQQVTAEGMNAGGVKKTESEPTHSTTSVDPTVLLQDARRYVIYYSTRYRNLNLSLRGNGETTRRTLGIVKSM